MLRNIFLKTIRDYRRSILIWGIGLSLFLLTVALSYNSLFGGPDRAKLIADFKKLTESVAFFNGKVYDVDTYGGYVSYNFARLLPLLLSIFPLLAGSALIRGEEERGSLDVLLSTPHSRPAVLLQKWAGMTVALLLIEVFCWLTCLVGAAAVGQSLDPGLTALALLNLSLLALIWGSLSMLIGQLVGTRKAALGWAGGILIVTFVFNSIARTVKSLDWLQYLSPFYYESLSKPLAPSLGINWGAIGGLAGLAVVLLAGAVLAYRQRDHSGVFRLFTSSPGGQASMTRSLVQPGQGWLSNSFTFGLRSTLPGAVIWGLGIAIYLVAIVSLLQSIRDSLVSIINSTDIYQSFGLITVVTNESLLHLGVFVLLVLICATYPVTLVAGWAAEETEGHLELILSTPQPRWRLLVERFAVAAICLAVTIGLGGLAFWLSTILQNIKVDTGRAFSAFFGLWVLGIIVVGVGWLLTAFGPGWSVAVLGGFVAVSYVTDLLATSLKLPEWLLTFSIFHQYGRPIVTGLDWLPQIVMLVLSGLFVGLALIRFRQRDISK